jgi:hypothetical protein
LRRNDSGKARQDDKGERQMARRNLREERIFRGVWVGQHESALAEVGKHQGRENQVEPGEAYRLGAKVSHVGVECFGSSDGEHDRAEDMDAM